MLLIFHALGMAFLVGGGIAVSLRVLGVASGARLGRFRGFFPVMWIGAGLALPGSARWVEAAALALWIGGIACGKLLLYTNTILLTTDLAP